MFAVRGTRPGQGFRVGAVVFHFAAWILVAELTEEHLHAARHGALILLEDVAGPEDVRLAPYPVTVAGEDKPTLRSYEELTAEFRAELARRDTDIANLHTQLLALEAENQQQFEDRNALAAQIKELESRLVGVAAEVANFPAETAAPPASVAELPKVPADVPGDAGHNDRVDLDPADAGEPQSAA